MKAKDIFGVIVRVLGLGCIGYGLRYVMSWLYVLVRQDATQGSGSDFLISAVLFLAVGFFLLRKADCVVEFSYPRDHEGQSKQ
jgi:hypothetical protein